MRLFDIFESICLSEVEGEDLYEMANLGQRNHGIDDVVIWVGKANKQHGLRVKVSNAKNRWDPSDNFVIQIPSLDYNPDRVARWITSNVINDILLWIKLNAEVLSNFENDRIVFTDDFLSKISKI